MCRWLAYTGAPLCLSEMIFEAEHSLIDQSLEAKQSETTTNGDGFGIGWYGNRSFPGIYKDVQPAWNDSNLRALAEQIESRLFLAHIRRATGTPVQRSNCHPFRHDNWLLVHNGVIRDFHKIKRDLVFAISPEYFPLLNGSTDSEVMFYLALTFGMASDVAGGVARMAGHVEAVGRQHGIEHPLQMTLGISDGDHLYAVRYSSEGSSRTLFHSESIAALKELTSAVERFSDDARAIVSEPLSDLAEAWVPVPEASFLTISGGDVQRNEFAPQPP